jgi:hypothetical protein
MGWCRWSKTSLLLLVASSDAALDPRSFSVIGASWWKLIRLFRLEAISVPIDPFFEFRLQNKYFFEIRNRNECHDKNTR